jgi:CRP/FNR family cyclic AMP-dependent transcriptional regulator
MDRDRSEDGCRNNSAAIRPATLFGQPLGEPLRQWLGAYPFPARLNQQHLQRLRISNASKFFDRRQYLFKEGDVPHCLYIVLLGRVRKFFASVHGKTLTLGFFGPGSVLGLDANILGRTYLTTAQADQTTEVLRIPRRDLIAELQSDAAAAWQALQIVSEQCRFLRGRLRSLELSESSSQKIAQCLLVLIAESSAEGDFVRLNLSQETIAQMAGVSRETVTRLFSRCRKKGVLNWNRRADATVWNRRSLETLAALAEGAS